MRELRRKEVTPPAPSRDMNKGLWLAGAAAFSPIPGVLLPVLATRIRHLETHKEILLKNTASMHEIHSLKIEQLMKLLCTVPINSQPKGLRETRGFIFSFHHLVTVLFLWLTLN